MSSERPEEGAESQPEARDESWDAIREAVRAAMDMGITDSSELAELINATRNEDLRATVNTIIEPLNEWRALMERLSELLSAREAVAEKQYQTELDLLNRIREVGKEADTPDGLYALAAAYAQLRAFSVAPGWYVPDVRHTGPDESSGEEDESKETKT
jgi:hypothetical protein